MDAVYIVADIRGNVCYNHGTGCPAIFTSQASAESFAKQVAQQHPTEAYYVLKSVAYVSVAPPAEVIEIDG